MFPVAMVFLADMKDAIETAGRIGYPCLLKAVAGGGGKGYAHRKQR